MKRLEIQSASNSSFQKAWELYLEAFPINERRELTVQKQMLQHSDYHFEVFLKNNEFIGFIAWWQFDGLRFVEHFATLDIHRGKGYGKLVLEDFISESKELVLLEVEHPSTEIDQRRIGFYERIGFKLNPYEYQQLPLRKSGEKVDLLVMTYPSAINIEVLENFENDFKVKCFEGYFN
ncbi:MAG TPA: GNAT family N-acetyltransferase [Brumimicrobium sp.]|nr:GNAT family N-acetyltransferase [Brumimicrobium sp.]